MSRPVLAQLNLQALKDNLQIVRRAAPGARVWSVVKANAYGHGIDRIWSALSATDGFALLNLEEAILLRERGWKGPILLLEGFFHADDLPLLDKYRLTTSVHSNWQIKAIQDAKLHAPLDIYLKVNSGMNRLGFQPERVHTVWQQLRAMKNVGEMTLMAHFADAEKPDGIADAMVRIEQAAEGLDCPRSLSNSAATLWHPEAHYNWVRPGIVLYGASPSGEWQDIANSGLKPVMTLRSEIIGVQTLKAGDTVLCFIPESGRFTAGYMLLGLVAVVDSGSTDIAAISMNGLNGLLIYLFGYLFTNIGAFMVVLGFLYIVSFRKIRRISSEDNSIDRIAGAQALLMQLESPLESVLAAAKIAHQNQTSVILNPAPARELPDELLTLVDIITPNETEAEKLTGIRVENDDDAAKAASPVQSMEKQAAIAGFPMGENSIYARPVRDLELSVRSENCLLRGGVHIIGELVSRTRDDLLKIRNLGKISLREIEEKLSKFDLHLSGDISAPLDDDDDDIDTNAKKQKEE